MFGCAKFNRFRSAQNPFIFLKNLFIIFVFIFILLSSFSIFSNKITAFLIKCGNFVGIKDHHIAWGLRQMPSPLLQGLPVWAYLPQVAIIIVEIGVLVGLAIWRFDQDEMLAIARHSTRVTIRMYR
jgi:hypothetical protein